MIPICHECEKEKEITNHPQDIVPVGVKDVPHKRIYFYCQSPKCSGYLTPVFVDICRDPIMSALAKASQ